MTESSTAMSKKTIKQILKKAKKKSKEKIKDGKRTNTEQIELS